MNQTGSNNRHMHVTCTVNASAGEVFSLLVDPNPHQDFDGSGLVRGAVTDSTIAEVGQVFQMHIHADSQGDYIREPRALANYDWAAITSERWKSLFPPVSEEQMRESLGHLQALFAISRAGPLGTTTLQQSLTQLQGMYTSWSPGTGRGVDHQLLDALGHDGIKVDVGDEAADRQCSDALQLSPYRTRQLSRGHRELTAATCLDQQVDRAGSKRSFTGRGSAARGLVSEHQLDQRRIGYREAHIADPASDQVRLEVLTGDGLISQVHLLVNPTPAQLGDRIEQLLLVSEVSTGSGMTDAKLAGQPTKGDVGGAALAQGHLRGVQERTAQIAVVIWRGRCRHPPTLPAA